MIYAMHEHELRSGVDITGYENDVAAALQQMKVSGLLQAVHLKGFHGKRNNRYAVLWIFENAEALTLNFGTPEQRKFPDDWLHYENVILARYLDRDPDTIDYTDYNMIKTFKFQP